MRNTDVHVDHVVTEDVRAAVAYAAGATRLNLHGVVEFMTEAKREHGEAKVRGGGTRFSALVQRRIHVRQNATRVEGGGIDQRWGAVVAARELLLNEACDFEWAELLCGGGGGEERRAQGDATGICLEVHCSLPNFNLELVLGSWCTFAPGIARREGTRP